MHVFTASAGMERSGMEAEAVKTTAHLAMASLCSESV